jgi:hypothetical protein
MNDKLLMLNPVSQRDGSNLYMTLHLREVDNQSTAFDGDQPLQVPAGWVIADGSPDDVRVCGAHTWQSDCLVFANGTFCGTAACDKPSHKGTCAADCSAHIFIFH